MTYPKELISIAIDYHFYTEQYDRQVCSGQNEYGGAMPMTVEENSLVQKNAIDERRKAETRGASKLFTRLNVGKAISEVGQYFDFEHELQKRKKNPVAFNKMIL